VLTALRMCARRALQTLPRRPGDRARGSGTFVLRDGVLVEGAGAPHTQLPYVPL
jgi:hypothetical protein